MTAESAQWQVMLFFFIALLIRDEAFSHDKMSILDSALLTVAACGILLECYSLIIRMRQEDDADKDETAKDLQAKNNMELQNEEVHHSTNVKKVKTHISVQSNKVYISDIGNDQIMEF